MFELRTDPIVGRQVLIAEDRAGRPNDFVSAKPDDDGQKSHDDCPFCAGHEQQTPAALTEVLDDHGRWLARVVPNKYPAVSIDGAESAQQRTAPLNTTAQCPIGVHEVIIESPRHVQDITELSCDEFAIVLQVYRDRLKRWSKDEQLRHATIFKNVGKAAGASLEHVHSQFVALPEIPVVVAQELQSAERYFANHKACIYCKLLDEELSHRQRLVVEADRFAAFCAYAGRQPYETWILPREHHASFQQANDADLSQLAELLQQTVLGLQKYLAPLSYNLILHTAPFSSDHGDHYHWHFELVPRSTQLAGFEWGTGMHINPLAPERAAAQLREALG